MLIAYLGLLNSEVVKSAVEVTITCTPDKDTLYSELICAKR